MQPQPPIKPKSERIAFFIANLLGGGAEKIMIKLARGVAERGYPVDLVVAHLVGPYLDMLHPSLNVVNLGRRRMRHALPSLVGYLRRTRPYALFSFMYDPNLIATLARKIARTPIRLVVSERASLSVAMQSQSRIRQRLTRKLIGLAYRSADGIVAVSNGVAEELVELAAIDRSRIQVIYNPVITGELLAKAAIDPAHPWFAPGQPPVVLAAGRLHEIKDYPTLLRAFAQARKVLPCRLMILGEGDERPYLKKLAGELGLDGSLDMPGFVSNPYCYMARSKLFVLTSRSEGLPNVLIEAMACGVPVISTDCRHGPREILDYGRLGQLVAVGDHPVLAQLMISCLKTTPPPVAQTALGVYRLETAVEQYLKVINL